LSINKPSEEIPKNKTHVYFEWFQPPFEKYESNWIISKRTINERNIVEINENIEIMCHINWWQDFFHPQ